MSEAAFSNSTKPSSGCVVLRVKRKREEDPAEALVVAKHSKLDAGASVFHFLGTLKEDASDGVILDRLKHYRGRSDHLKSNPLARLSLEDTKSQTRERSKAKSSAQRFKVTSQLRCLQESGEETCGATATDGGGRGGDGPAPATATPSGSEADKVHICEVDLEIFSEERPTATAGEVTCNDTVMVKEKAERNRDGYVYDLYCTKEPGMLDMESATFDWTSLSVYESELVHNIIDDQEEAYDDEDDSNDEDNWRNDYPDEEGSTLSSGSELDDCGEYRHRQALYSSGEEYGL